MKTIILDLFDIPKYSTKEKSYYLFNFIIPINSIYKLYLLPYYSNSPYYKRNIFDSKDFEYLISNKFTYKSISQKIYNTGNCYNPNLGKGDIIDTEVIPIKVSKFNIINDNFYISKITIYTNQKYDLEFKKNFNITIDEFTPNAKNVKIECILISIINNPNFDQYEFLCKDSPTFTKSNSYFLYCSDLIKLKQIDKCNNILFTCKII